MKSWPIVSRELAVAARRPVTRVARVLAGCAGLAVCFFVLSGAGAYDPTGTSRALLSWFAGVVFIYCLLAGLPGTADCLSLEKREGTLGLLFLTDLSGRDVVFGKVAATAVNSLYCILALFPILAITFILGGVSLYWYAYFFLTAFNLLFLSLSVGIFASSVCVMARRSVGLAIAILLVLNLTPIVAAGFSMLVLNLPALEVLAVLAPLLACSLFIGHQSSLGLERVLISFVFTHLYAWLFFIMACRILPRSWEHREPRPSWSWSIEWVRRFTEGSRAVKRAWRKRCLDENAYFWLAAREKHRGRLPWIFLGSLVIIWVYGWWNADFENWWLGFQVCISFALMAQGFMKIWIAVQASQQFIEDRQCGALELLLCTPLSISAIIDGQWGALRRQFSAPMVTMVALEILLLGAGSATANRAGALTQWFLLGVVNLLFVGLDLWALIWLSLANGISERQSGRSAVIPLAKILFLPYLLGLAVWAYFGFHFRRGGSGIEAIYIWFYQCALLDVISGFWARGLVYERFRSSAWERYAKPKPGVV